MAIDLSLHCVPFVFLTSGSIDKQFLASVLLVVFLTIFWMFLTPLLIVSLPLFLRHSHCLLLRFLSRLVRSLSLASSLACRFHRHNNYERSPVGHHSQKYSSERHVIVVTSSLRLLSCWLLWLSRCLLSFHHSRRLSGGLLRWLLSCSLHVRNSHLGEPSSALLDLCALHP